MGLNTAHQGAAWKQSFIQTFRGNIWSGHQSWAQFMVRFLKIYATTILYTYFKKCGSKIVFLYSIFTNKFSLTQKFKSMQRLRFILASQIMVSLLHFVFCFFCVIFSIQFLTRHVCFSPRFIRIHTIWPADFAGGHLIRRPFWCRCSDPTRSVRHWPPSRDVHTEKDSDDDDDVILVEGKEFFLWLFF